ncbi:MAG TPA: FAD-binding oxidoreductase [Gaiellaceae bacterium]|nr:FAD-binding oxidoreductase [Gaiellaceae bacterium]
MSTSADVPAAVRFVVVGAGVHGLSTAAHLADRLGSGEQVLVLDKSRVGAGASGISGGIVRNFYAAPAMHELVRRSVELFELDPQLFGFRQVGYVAVVPEAQADELGQIAAAHAEAGYASTLVEGVAPVRDHLRRLFPDWRAHGSAAALHEHRSGWADAGTTVAALAGLARAGGVQLAEGVEVTGFELEAGGAVRAVETSAGQIACDAAVLAPGPWARDLWRLLDLPAELEGSDGPTPAFRYWQVREGEYRHVAGALEPTAPVVHLDADVPVSHHLPDHWGIYFRPGLGGGVAAGGLPVALDPDCELDPYGPSHPELGATTPAFDEAIEASLAWALGRFRTSGGWSSTSFAAPTVFTPDAYPVVGYVRENVYAVLDSNHGFKLLALGKLAAAELLGQTEPVLEPFRLERFAEAAVHPASASPYPWT